MIDHHLHETRTTTKQTEQINLIQEITKEGAQKFFQRFPDIDKAFIKDHTFATCIDEGCVHMCTDGGKFSMAGTGILFPAENREARLNAVANIYSQHGVKEITSHSGCGAAKLAYMEAHPETKADTVSGDAINEFAIEWSRDLADKMTAVHKHIELSEMARPADYHNAIVAYYDGSGCFNPDKIAGLPMGFVINRKYLPKEYALQELRVAISIALGDHGLGNKFTPELPFTIIAIGDNSLRQEAQDMLAENKDGLDTTRIKVDNFVII